jgi:hypothetical protein
VTFVDGLYHELFTRGLLYFLPDTEWLDAGPVETVRAELGFELLPDGRLALEWLGTRRESVRSGRPFTDAELRMVKTVGAVLKGRYALLFNPPLAAEDVHLFRGLSEDQYVSAFLGTTPDRVTAAIEVLRISSTTTYCCSEHIATLATIYRRNRRARCATRMN